MEKALATLASALERTPSQAVLHRARARVLTRLHDSDEALHELGQAIALSADDDPRRGDDFLERGRILRHVGRLEEALAECDRALEVRPKWPEAERLRGALLLALDRFGEAVRAFDVCLAASPASPTLREARGLALA